MRKLSQEENNKYINTYILNLEKMVLMTLLRAGIETNIENRLVDTAGEREGEEVERVPFIYIIGHVKKK